MKWLAVLLLACGGTGQSSMCIRWLACAAALPEERRGENDEAVYGPNGQCWNGAPDVAKNCDAACKSNLLAQSAMQGAPLECR
ncbi:MAG: hypothetical protein JNK82_08180 [Myxococcaceae bacterium]|nr:hypothetical protein [Myxococcaceae bacterium]